MHTQTAAPHIQHTLIDIAVDRSAMERHCGEALEHGFDAVMVAPIWVRLAARIVAGSQVKVATAVDFPYGSMTTAGKVAEARSVVEAGAQEVDLGTHVGLLRSGEWRAFRDDIASVTAAVQVPVKVMLELPRLTSEERDLAVDLSVEAGAAWVKNASSGAAGHATVEDVAYLRSRAPRSVRVKASGGITTLGQVEQLLAAGADLVGTSAGVAILTGALSARSY